MSFNFLKTQSKKEIKKNLDIQIQNNKVLRNALQIEQKANKEANIKIQQLQKEIEALKKNVRVAYNTNLDKPKRTRTTRKPKGEANGNN